MFAVVFALSLFGSIDHSLVVKDRVDLIELNHFYDDKGKLVFDQWIFYDWRGRTSEFVVVAWRLSKDTNFSFPVKSYKTRQYVFLFHDRKSNGLLRRVTSPCYRETWTQYDPELVNREKLPQEQRRGLRKPQRKSDAH